MSVVSAAVSWAVFTGDGVHVRAEGSGGQIFAFIMFRKQPSVFLNDFHGGVLFQKGAEGLQGDDFTAGQLRTGVQFVSERRGEAEILFFHRITSGMLDVICIIIAQSANKVSVLYC